MIRIKEWNAVMAAVALCVAAGCSERADLLSERDRGALLAQRADEKRKTGDADTAIQLYAAALDENPRMANAHLDLALLLHDRKNSPDRRTDYLLAIYHYRRFLELQPDTEKTELVGERIRLAEQCFAASIFPGGQVDLGRLNQLEGENANLRAEIRQIRQEAARKARSAESSRPLATTTGATHVATSAGAAPRGGAPAAGKAAGTARKQEAAPEGGTAPASRTYRVKDGDTLWKIAAEVYRDPQKWELILKANRATLERERKLRSGQVLTIPPAPDRA